MDFSNERYVRLYVRDTVTWKRLGWDGQNATSQLLRKADRSGVIDLSGLEPWESLVVLCGAPEDQARRGVARMLELEVLVHDGDRLVFPRYIEANECAQSDAQRQRESRARRAVTRMPVTKRDAVQSQNVTECHGQSQHVTDSHSQSQVVTPCRAVPYSEEESAPPPVTKRDSASPALDQHIRIGFEKRLQKVADAGAPNQRVIGALVRDLTPWVQQTAPLRKLSENELCDRVLDGFFASSKAKAAGYPPSFLATNPLEYLNGSKPQPAAARVPDGIPPLRNHAPRTYSDLDQPAKKETA